MIPNKILTRIECVEMNWANFIGGGFLLGCGRSCASRQPLPALPYLPTSLWVACARDAQGCASVAGGGMPRATGIRTSCTAQRDLNLYTRACEYRRRRDAGSDRGET